MAQTFIDPHEMPSVVLSKNGEFSACSNIFTDRYYKRLVNMMINSLSEDPDAPDTYRGDVIFNVDKGDFEYLKKFAECGENDLKDYQNVDKIISNMLTMRPYQYDSSIMMSSVDLALAILEDKRTYLILLVLFVIMLIYKLLKARFTVRYMFSYLLLVIWIVDFAFTWKHLLQVGFEVMF